MAQSDGAPPQPPTGVIPEQPDLNTLELATYGTEYLDVKSVLYLIDMMREIAERDYDATVAGCHGAQYELVRRMLQTRPYIVTQEKPHVENYEELMAVRKAKQIYRAASAVRTLEKWRVEVEAYGSLHGAYEYGQAMTESGVSADIMRRTFKKRASQGKVNSYASIRDQREGMLNAGLSEEDRALARMAEMILMAGEYERMEREYPEDDSARRVAARAAAGPKGPEPAPSVDDGAVDAVPDHVGSEFDPPTPKPAPEPEPEAESEGRVHLGPMASSLEDAVGSVPDEDLVWRASPGGVIAEAPEDDDASDESSDASEEAIHEKEPDGISDGISDEIPDDVPDKSEDVPETPPRPVDPGPRERIGPSASSMDEALDFVEAAMGTFFPTTRTKEFAEWYGRRPLTETVREHVDYDDEGNTIIIIDPEAARCPTCSSA